MNDFTKERVRLGISERYAGPGCCVLAEGIVYWAKKDLRVQAEVFNDPTAEGIVGPASNGWTIGVAVRGNPRGGPLYIYLQANVENCPKCHRDLSSFPKPKKAPGRDERGRPS